MDTLQSEKECYVSGCNIPAVTEYVYGEPYNMCYFHKQELILNLEFDKELRNKYLEKHLEKERNQSK